MSVGTTCREVIGFLDDYFGATLDPERQRRFEGHLAECPSCAAYLATYRTTVALARATAAEAEALPEELVRAILAARG